MIINKKSIPTKSTSWHLQKNILFFPEVPLQTSGTTTLFYYILAICSQHKFTHFVVEIRRGMYIQQITRSFFIAHMSSSY